MACFYRKFKSWNFEWGLKDEEDRGSQQKLVFTSEVIGYQQKIEETYVIDLENLGFFIFKKNFNYFERKYRFSKMRFLKISKISKNSYYDSF